MKENFRNATYYTNDLATFQKVGNGFRALWDEEGIYKWGELVATVDFNEDAFCKVEFEATDFENADPYYQRQMTEEVAMEAENKG